MVAILGNAYTPWRSVVIGAINETQDPAFNRIKTMYTGTFLGGNENVELFINMHFTYACGHMEFPLLKKYLSASNSLYIRRLSISKLKQE